MDITQRMAADINALEEQLMIEKKKHNELALILAVFTKQTGKKHSFTGKEAHEVLKSGGHLEKKFDKETDTITFWYTQPEQKESPIITLDQN